MESGNGGGFVVDKGEATECDFGLGLKMVMMGSQHNRHSHNDDGGSNTGGFSGDQETGSSGGCYGGATGVDGSGNFGAMFCSSTNNNQESTTGTRSSTMYDLVGGAVAASSVASSVQRSSLPSSHAFDPSPFKSCGVLMGLGGGGTMTRAFTTSQRQELERQKVIYKYMAASMPIPPELLIPINPKYPSQPSLPPYLSNDHGTSGGKSVLDLKYTLGSRDPEPWRCRRTDGKKWRCSRDVAPDQKYCERHSHKGRPSRSRKHVESSASSSSTSSSSSISSGRINNSNNKNNPLMSSSTSSAINPANINIKPSFLYQTSPAMFLSHSHHNPSQYSHSRLPEWFMKREAHNDHANAGVPTASPFFPQTELDQVAPTHLRTSSELMGNNQTQPSLPRQFLDAWSMGEKSDGNACNSSLLTLSMAGGGMESCNESEQEEKWMGYSAPGGPLAEALCLGIVGADGSGNGAGGGRGSHGHGESGEGLGFIK